MGMGWLRRTVSSICLLPAVAAAQDNAIDLEDTPLDLGTIVVKGELQPRDLFETSTSAVVITGETLEQRGDRDLVTTIERIPNVTSTFGEKGFAIRGIDQRGVGTAGQGLLVSTQVDGVALPSNQSTFFGPFSTWDLEQVEVLRGPQSTQQGRNALAGAIIVRSRDPEFFNEYRLRGEIGTRGILRGSLMLNQALTDRFALRFSADARQDNGFVQNPFLGTNYDEREAQTYRLKAAWKASETVDVIFGYTYAENEGGEDLVESSFFPQNRFNFSNVPADEGSKHNLVDLRVNWQASSGIMFESETNYYHLDYRRLEDGDNSPFDFAVLNRTGNSESFEQDFRLRFTSGNLSGVAGVFYTNFDNSIPADLVIDTGIAVGAPPTGMFITRSTDFATETDNYAIYGEVDIDAAAWAPGLSFTLGGRYDYEEFSFNEFTRFDMPFPPSTQGAGSTSFDAFLPKAAIHYEFNLDQRVSFTYQKGYRAGGARVNEAGQLNEFDSEFTDNYEIAYRGRFMDDLVFVSANAFFTDWSNQQVNVQVGSIGPIDVFDTVNAGGSEVWGGEFSIDAQATSNLAVYGSLGYAKTEFTNFVLNGQQLAGNAFPFASEVTAGFGGRYVWNNGVSLGADVSYT
ncbi:MAG: TonB-dependent receptor, partial [Pseudomonadota bacterium]